LKKEVIVEVSPNQELQSSLALIYTSFQIIMEACNLARVTIYIHLSFGAFTAGYHYNGGFVQNQGKFLTNFTSNAEHDFCSG